MSVYEGRWDCSSCGTLAIRGPLTRCPQCGASRPADVQFYLPADSESLVGESHRAAAFGGADWICGHCRTQNKAREAGCAACGNPRDASSEDVDLSEKTYGLDELPRDGRRPRQVAAPPPRRRQPRPWLRSVLALAVLLFGGWMLLRTFPQTVEVEVVGFAWERELQLLHHEAVQKEGWSRPAEAFDVESFRAIKSYQQVLKGYEKRTRKVKVQVGTESYVCGKIDKGNGYFVDRYCTRPVYDYRSETYEAPVYEQVPIYATKYRYQVFEWVAHARNQLRTSGQDQSPYWPEDPRLTQTQTWRAGPKSGHYAITVREPNGTTHREEVNEAFWQRLEPGQRIPAQKAYLIGTWYGLKND